MRDDLMVNGSMANGAGTGADARVVLVGIDGGGTRTRLRLATPDGAILAEGAGGSANVATDADLAWRSIREALAQALSAAGLSADGCRLVAGVGLAGAEVAGAAARFLALPPLFARITLVSDAYTSCVGAHGGRDGAIVAVGTGMVGYAIAGARTRRVSGWGFPQGDEGGGAWIGLQAIGLMLHAIDGRAPRTALTDALQAMLTGEGAEPTSWAVGARAADFARLAPLVVGLAGEGDAQARAVLGRAGAEIDAALAALRDGAEGDGFAGLSCCLLGGLAPVLEPYLSAGSQAALSPPRGNAIEGAVLLARRLHGTAAA